MIDGKNLNLLLGINDKEALLAGDANGDPNSSMTILGKLRNEVLQQTNGIKPTLGSNSLIDFLKINSDNIKGSDTEDAKIYMYVWSDQTIDGPESVMKKCDEKTALGKMFVDSRIKGKTATAVLVNSPLLKYGDLHSSSVSAYLNMLPPTVLNALVPYVDVEFEFLIDKDSYNKESSLNQKQPGLLKFLMRSTDSVDPSSADKKMLDARIVGQNESIKDSSGVRSIKAYAGMEMFTSPVTLNNPEINFSRGPDGKGPLTRVLDPFSPIASLTDLSIKINSAGKDRYTLDETMASLKFVIHDKSRANEFASLLQPSLYSQVVVWITYGMRYRGYSSSAEDDVFSKFINNNMLVKQAYRVYSSKYDIDKKQINVSLEMSTNTTTEVLNLRLSGLVEASKQDNASPSDADSDTTLQKVSDKIKVIVARLKSKKTSEISSIVGEQLIMTVQNMQGLDQKIDVKKALEAFDKKASAAVNNPNLDDSIREDIRDLKAKIDEQFENGGETYATLYSSYKQSVNSRVSTLFENLFSSDDVFSRNLNEKEALQEQSVVPDPFSEPSQKDLKAKVKKAAPIAVTSVDMKRRVTIGSVLSCLYGKAFLQDPSVDEVQLFFYSLNDKAKTNNNAKNVAEITVDVAQYKYLYANECLRKGAEVLTVPEATKILLDLASDPRNACYEISKSYKPWTHDGKAEYVDGHNNDEKFLKNIREFKRPAIKTFVTSHPSGGFKAGSGDLLRRFEASASEQTSARSSSEKNIIRIEFSDVQDESAFSQVLSKNTISDGSAAQALKNELQKNNEASLGRGVRIVSSTSTKKYNIQFDSPDDAKNFVSRYVPTINIGANGSAVISAAVETTQDRDLNTHNIISTREGSLAGLPFSTVGPYGLPVYAMPQSMNMTVVGCPLIRYNQLFFVDFNTNTQLDNRYRVVDISHNFKPGSYTTNIRLVIADAYGQYKSPLASLEDLIDRALAT